MRQRREDHAARRLFGFRNGPSETDSVKACILERFSRLCRVNLYVGADPCVRPADTYVGPYTSLSYTDIQTARACERVALVGPPHLWSDAQARNVSVTHFGRRRHLEV